MRCPKCERESVDLLTRNKKGDSYGCPRCHTMFTVEIEPYDKEVDDSEIKADWEEQAQKLKEAM